MPFTSDFFYRFGDSIFAALEEFAKGENIPQSGLSLILLIWFLNQKFKSNYFIFRHRTSQMQLNPVYYVEFSYIDPFRRSAAFKISELSFIE